MSRQRPSLLTGEAPPAFPNRPCGRETQHLHCPDGYAGRERDNKINLAIQICRWCDHQQACADWAVQHDERYGVWGGTTPGQRADLRWIGLSRTHAQPAANQQHEDTA